jgi:GR25 family glycosyltransferase involved in LPS biosynthesis
MSSPLNSYCDKVVCINLLERKDKKDFMQSRFDKHEINVSWYHPVKFGFIPSIAKPIIDSKCGHFNAENPYEIAASISHYHVIKTALLEGVQKLCVFEDDAIFRKDYNEQLTKYLSTVPTDANGLLFYSFMYTLEPQNVRVNARWMKAFRSWSLLNYIFDREMMTEYIKRQDALFQIADKISYDIPNTSNLNMYVSTPALVLPSKELASNIRTVKNYETTQTVTQLGVNTDLYE